MKRFLRDHGVWVALLVLLNVVLFADALFTNKTFFFRDTSFFHYPLKRLVTEAYSQGEWPLWNPYIQLGQPLLANPNSMAVYPTQLLFQILPFEFAFELHFVLHCILAGVATYFVARALEFSGSAAFVAAAVFNFSGVTLSFVNLFNILPAVTFLPTLTLALLKLAQRINFSRMAVTSFLFGAFFLLLEPLTSLAIALFLGLFLPAWWLWHAGVRSQSLKFVGCLGASIVSGLLLASVQIFPTLELIQHSGRRGLDYSVVTGWSMPPITLLQSVSPRAFGDFFKLTQMAPWASSFFENREPYLLSCYFGAFALLLTVFGLAFSEKRWMTHTLTFIASLGALLSLGKYSGLYSWLFQYCPPFRFGRYPVKFLLIVTFCVALLSGYGVHRLNQLKQIANLVSIFTKRRFVIMGILPLLLLSVVSIIVPLFDKFWEQAVRIPKSVIMDAAKHIQIHIGAFLGFLLLLSLKKVRREIGILSASAFVLFDLFIGNFWINPVIDNELYEPAPAALYLQEKMQNEGVFRIYSLAGEKDDEETRPMGNSDSIAWSYFYRKLSLTQFLAAKDHVQYSVFNPVDRLETLPSQLINAELSNIRSQDEKLKFVAGLNVRYILSNSPVKSPQVTLAASFPINSPQPVRVYRLLNALPRAFLTDVVTASSDSFEFREALSVSEAHGVADPEPETTSSAGGFTSGAEQVRILKYAPNQVELEANANRKRTLVLLDSFYPGWRATVDGVEVPVAGANFVYRAISFPSGFHRVKFSYEPRSFHLGLSVTLATAVVWMLTGLGLTFGRLRRKTAAEVETFA
jgi:hypothetical protein